MSKTVLVTGASRGIGRAIALAFAREGYTVLVNYNTSSNKALAVVEEITSFGGRAVAFRADVSDADGFACAVNALTKDYGNVDVLVANAGVSLVKQINDTSSKDWDDLFGTNAKGVYNAVKAVVDGMISKKQGRIITVSSVWGEVGASCEVAYSSSKAAVIGFTKALAKELAPSNITVNCISPGVIDTDMNACFTGEDRAQIESEIPMGRYGRPEEVASAALFFASDGASYITGEVLGVNGGFR